MAGRRGGAIGVRCVRAADRALSLQASGFPGKRTDTAMEDHTEFGRMERQGWSDDATAAAYASGFASAARHCVPALVHAVGARAGSAALDLCCGHGVVAAGLLASGATVTGVDFSPAMLALARALVPGVEFLEGDATDLPFGDATFDAVTMGFGILHIPDAERALAEARRVLRPGGRFAYSVWHGPERSAAFRIVFDCIAAHGDPSVTLPPGPATHAYADADFAFAALEAAGFSAPRLETADSHWIVDDPGRPFDHFSEGTVRGAFLLRNQPEANRVAIRAAVGEAVRAELGPDGPWRVAIPAAIVSATA
jgi:SAM-dependent methyltransferase